MLGTKDEETENESPVPPKYATWRNQRTLPVRDDSAMITTNQKDLCSEQIDDVELTLVSAHLTVVPDNLCMVDLFTSR